MDSLEECNYRGLQALAKKNGVKANGSKEDLKTRLAAALGCNTDYDIGTPKEESSTLRGVPDTEPTANEPGFCCKASRDIPESDGEVVGDQTRDTSAVPQPGHVVDSGSPAGKVQHGEVLSEVSAHDIPNSNGKIADDQARATSAAPQPSHVVDDKSQADEVKPGEVLSQASEGRTNERLFPNRKESASKTPRGTKVKMPMAGPALRFERMHQTLFAGQTSIELYGSNPKKTAPTKENMPLSKNQPFSPIAVRPAACGSGVKPANRGVTVASKPPTLVVQRSTKKPTQVKEFQLSGRREAFTFRPYSGPVLPITPGNKTASFKVGHQPKQAHKCSGRKAIKTTLASGRAQISRRKTKIESSKAQREKKVQAQREGVVCEP